MAVQIYAPTRVKVMVAAVGGSALIALGLLGVASGWEQPATGVTAKSSHLTVGATTTPTTPPTAPGTGLAVPAIKGPAPMPSEEEAAK
jgi:hypothetical protein